MSSQSKSSTSFLIVISLLFSPLYLVDVKCVQFYHQEIPVPAVGPWRYRDGFQFQIQNPADGTYHFGYDTGNSYREERKNSLGQVFGKYGWLDPDGILRTVEYYADKENGFRSQQTDLAPLDNPSASANANIPVIGPIPKPFLFGQPYHYLHQPQQLHPLTQHLTFNPIPVPIQIPSQHQHQHQLQQPQPKQIPAPSPAPTQLPIPLPLRKYRNEKIKAPLSN